MDNNIFLTFGISAIITLIIMPMLIPFLHKLKFGQVQREEGLDSHKKKGGTPTMGGVVFVMAPIFTLFLVYPKAFSNMDVIVAMIAYLGYALIGLLDDCIIVIKKDNEGLRPKYKFALQSILAILFYFVYRNIAGTHIVIPIFHLTFDLNVFYFFFIFIMFTAETNAVNFTDGLDGLCAGTCLIAFFPFILFAFAQGKYEFGLFLLAVSGSLLAYLKFNLHPAKIFMGDTGSLALGGLFAASAMITKQELLTLIVGGVFLFEMLSVVIQVSYYKKTKKRIFKMAPLHHHFELCGFKETQVVILFWSFALVCAMLGIWIGFL